MPPCPNQQCVFKVCLTAAHTTHWFWFVEPAGLLVPSGQGWQGCLAPGEKVLGGHCSQFGPAAQRRTTQHVKEIVSAVGQGRVLQRGYRRFTLTFVLVDSALLHASYLILLRNRNRLGLLRQVGLLPKDRPDRPCTARSCHQLTKCLMGTGCRTHCQTRVGTHSPWHLWSQPQWCRSCLQG